MRYPIGHLATIGIISLLAVPAVADPIYNNLTPNNSIALATNPSGSGVKEIEAADDFVLSSQSLITNASFVGLLVPGTGGTPSVTQVVIEIYSVFPTSSDTGRTPNVPTRVNSPSDVAFTLSDSSTSGLSFTTAVVSATFTASNSVAPGGIHPSPNQTTGGNGPITGQEVQFDITFLTPLNLPPGHYFFVPQVALSNGGQFYWLSASRPISGAGTTPFSPDLQAWTRDADLSPDWLRAGTDIVGGGTPPTFNAAFSLDGSTVPEPSTIVLFTSGTLLLGLRRLRRSTKIESPNSCVR